MIMRGQLPLMYVNRCKGVYMYVWASVRVFYVVVCLYVSVQVYMHTWYIYLYMYLMELIVSDVLVYLLTWMYALYASKYIFSNTIC